MGSKPKRNTKAYKEICLSPLGDCSQSSLEERKDNMVEYKNGSLPPSIHTSLFCDLEASPIKRYSLFLHLLNLGLPCDLLRPSEGGGCDLVPVLERETETQASLRERLLSWLLALMPASSLPALGSWPYMLPLPSRLSGLSTFPFWFSDLQIPDGH